MCFPFLLVIGRKGERIMRMQAESGCKIQMAPRDNTGLPDRVCTLTGNTQSIALVYFINFMRHVRSLLRRRNLLINFLKISV